MNIDLSSVLKQPAQNPPVNINEVVIGRPATPPPTPMVMSSAKDPAFFPVELHPVNHSANGKTYDDSGFRAVVDEESGTIIGMHKSRYALVRNEEVVTQFEEALKHSAIDTTGMKIKTEFSHNRARMFRQYTLPKHAVNPAVGDTVEMRLTLNNSYDGSLCFDYSFGGYRLACKNGMVVPDGDLVGRRRKHTSGIDIASVAQTLSKSAEKYQSISTDWAAWTSKLVTDAQAEMIIGKIPSLTDETREKIFEYFTTEATVMGKTVWAVYNAITFWSTHQSVRKASQVNIASITRERENRVASALKSKDFLSVV